jgi:type II secretory pathway pseudopilin PulG|tara:strand:+ start:1054 stop:1824 length:771 start_codon:yes stop_codon:yes gene_type:complete
MIKRKINGFTLTEALVAIVIGMISVAAIFFSYQTFNKAFISVEAKSQMNSNARDALSQMTRELRNTCRVDINWVGHTNPLLTESQCLSKFISPRGASKYAAGASYLIIFYDNSPNNRVRVDYGLKKYKNSNDTYLARTYMVMNCIDPNNCSFDSPRGVRNVDQIFINNVEDFQVVLKDNQGVEVTNVNSLAGKPGIQNQLKVKTIEIYLTVRSRNKVYKSKKTWKIKNEDREYTVSDQYHRDTYFVSVYPRNIVKN